MAHFGLQTVDELSSLLGFGGCYDDFVVDDKMAGERHSSVMGFGEGNEDLRARRTRTHFRGKRDLMGVGCVEETV